MIKFLCPTLNNLQTFNEGTVTHTVSRPVHTSASMACVTAAVVHPPISGSAAGNDGMQTVSFTKPDAKIKWCEFRGTWKPSNWAANLSQSISVKTFDPDVPPEPHCENAKALHLVGLACHLQPFLSKSACGIPPPTCIGTLHLIRVRPAKQVDCRLWVPSITASGLLLHEMLM
jgi:hypothetical protein